MRPFIIAIFLLLRLTSLCQSSYENSALLNSDYSQIQNALYKISNSHTSIKRMQDDAYDTIASFIKKYPKSENGLYLIGAAVNLTYLQVDTLINLLDSSLNKSPYKGNAEYTKRRIWSAETGKLFPSLNLPDSSGKTVTIENYRGKTLLIDFWSSWCKPCRQEIPDLKKIYSKFKNRDFEMIGISMDRDRAAWLNAVREDKQSWKQYCELVPWKDNKIANRFYIFGIPANFLLDKNGIILGQDLSPEQIAYLASIQ